LYRSISQIAKGWKSPSSVSYWRCWMARERMRLATAQRRAHRLLRLLRRMRTKCLRLRLRRRKRRRSWRAMKWRSLLTVKYVPSLALSSAAL
jgi:hypothetical protein